LPDGSSAKIVINPRFQQTKINPRFQQTEINPRFQQTEINPRFQQTEINPRFQQTEQPTGTVHINPNFKPSPPARYPTLINITEPTSRDKVRVQV
jgi:ribosomal protein L21E